jgi:hypothetical protein
MDAEGSKWGNQARWSLSADLAACAVVADVALASHPAVALRASVRGHRSRLVPSCFGRSERSALRQINKVHPLNSSSQATPQAVEVLP